MKPSLVHWTIGLVAAFGAHALALTALGSYDPPAMMERGGGPMISVAGSLDGFAVDAEPVEQETIDEIEPEDPPQEVEPVETATVEETPLEPETAAIPLEQKKLPPKKTKPKKKRKPITRSRAGKRGGGGGRSAKNYAGKAALSNFKGRVRARIARRARSAKGRGTVVVRFTVTAGGGVAGVRVIRSANATLNRAAIQAVRGGFPPIPPGLPRRITFTVPIAFR